MFFLIIFLTENKKNYCVCLRIFFNEQNMTIVLVFIKVRILLTDVPATIRNIVCSGTNKRQL